MIPRRPIVLQNVRDGRDDVIFLVWCLLSSLDSPRTQKISKSGNEVEEEEEDGSSVKERMDGRLS